MKKHILLITACALATLFLLLFCLYFAPKIFLRNIDPATIATIRVFDGADGTSFVITDPTDIESVVVRIQSTKLKRDKLSANYDGFRFSLTFVDQNGKTVETLILNSADSLRCDPFFYEPAPTGHGIDTDDEKLPFHDIEGMKEKYAK